MIDLSKTFTSGNLLRFHFAELTFETTITSFSKKPPFVTVRDLCGNGTEGIVNLSEFTSVYVKGGSLGGPTKTNQDPTPGFWLHDRVGKIVSVAVPGMMVARKGTLVEVSDDTTWGVLFSVQIGEELQTFQWKKVIFVRHRVEPKQNQAGVHSTQKPASVDLGVSVLDSDEDADLSSALTDLPPGTSRQSPPADEQ